MGPAIFVPIFKEELMPKNKLQSIIFTGRSVSAICHDSYESDEK